MENCMTVRETYNYMMDDDSIKSFMFPVWTDSEFDIYLNHKNMPAELSKVGYGYGTMFISSKALGTIHQIWVTAPQITDDDFSDFYGFNCFLLYDFETGESHFIEQDLRETHEIFVYRVEYSIIDDDVKIPVGVYNDFQEVYNHLDYGIHYDVFINTENGKIARVHRKSGFSSTKFYCYEIRQKGGYNNIPYGDDIYTAHLPNSNTISINVDTPRPIHFQKYP